MLMMFSALAMAADIQVGNGSLSQAVESAQSGDRLRDQLEGVVGQGDESALEKPVRARHRRLVRPPAQRHAPRR